MIILRLNEQELKGLFEKVYILGLNGDLNPHKFNKWYKDNVNKRVFKNV